ncbi:MAG: DNA polymerase/3'-5' exonuclease PolX [Phycisphaerae bacterium]|nr:MAG: DNA polymerase/3'-5' exonuclease PolX [Planctomycetia bacterium]GJQ25762.1 MAG: DNA polymerase/3'-5' exonuclease PolX [Phycisphaerae bacterium]
MPATSDLISLFNEIADILEINGEQVFRVNSYRRAARSLKDVTEPLAELAARGGLADLPGIGKSMAAKIEEFLSTGKITMHEELCASIPPGLLKLRAIPGMGPKKIALVWKELGVDSLDALRAKIQSGELAKLKGMGEKSVEQIAKGIDFAERSGDRTPLGVAWTLADEILAALRKITGVRRAEAAGSLRRGCETIGDVDILCESENGAAVIEVFTKLPQAVRVLAAGETKGSILVERRGGGELQIDCRVVPRESYGTALQYFTGSKEHNVRLRELAVRKKFKLNEWGLFSGDKAVAGEKEEDVYKKLGLPWIPPELREDRGELELKESPRLIELSDIRGDLHMHTTASDGTMSAAEMADAASKRGYEYIAITDHSRSSAIANGLTIDRMWRQIEKIRALNKDHKTITVLIGCECDILADGKLDYPDSLLAACDLVVASVHAAQRQDRAKITARVLKAMENPYVTILGHPTGRLINKREPMDLDMAAVVKQAAKTHTILEINSSWQRLDLNDLHARMARDAGVMVAINTDSHAAIQMEQMKFGVTIARRAGLEAKQVLNTLPLPSVRKRIARKRNGE